MTMTIGDSDGHDGDGDIVSVSGLHEAPWEASWKLSGRPLDESASWGSRT